MPGSGSTLRSTSSATIRPIPMRSLPRCSQSPSAWTNTARPPGAARSSASTSGRGFGVTARCSGSSPIAEHDPSVSVVLPVHNGERFLREALDSVLGQTFGDLELIVVDDGSTDSTPSILGLYPDSRLRVLTLPHVGLVEALNHGVGQARGRFVARMDADDVSLPSRLERQVELLDRRREAGLVATWVAVIDEQGRQVDQRVLPAQHVDLHRRLLLRNPFQHGSVMLRREVFDRVGAYRDDYGHNEDYDLWRRVARAYELATVPEVLYRYRVHEG